MRHSSMLGMLLAALSVGPGAPLESADPVPHSRRHRYDGGHFRSGRKTSPPRGRTHDPVTGVRLTVKYPANGHRP